MGDVGSETCGHKLVSLPVPQPGTYVLAFVSFPRPRHDQYSQVNQSQPGSALRFQAHVCELSLFFLVLVLFFGGRCWCWFLCYRPAAAGSRSKGLGYGGAITSFEEGYNIRIINGGRHCRCIWIIPLGSLTSSGIMQTLRIAHAASIKAPPGLN